MLSSLFNLYQANQPPCLPALVGGRWLLIPIMHTFYSFDSAWYNCFASIRIEMPPNINAISINNPASKSTSLSKQYNIANPNRNAIKSIMMWHPPRSEERGIIPASSIRLMPTSPQAPPACTAGQLRRSGFDPEGRISWCWSQHLCPCLDTSGICMPLASCYLVRSIAVSVEFMIFLRIYDGIPRN